MIESPADPAGGGLVGIASTFPTSGAPLIEALRRLRWRGNGLGGGVALVGCFPRFQGHYALNIALLQVHTRHDMEQTFVAPYFDISDAEFQPELDDHRGLPGLAERPPRVIRYFVRARVDALAGFAERNGLAGDLPAAEDEFVYRCAMRLNRALYAGEGARTAFVLSFGRDTMILKGVGYADAVARFYRLDAQDAYIWLGCQHGPTHAHPGGAPPFPALDGALALSGGFANRYALTTYIRQRGYRPLFRADGELGAMLFDLYSRACAYRLDLALEALAPTSPAGLARLSTERRDLYRALQHTHAHGIPEGATFIALARRLHDKDTAQLIGAVDADARRPNVFALQEGTLRRGERYGVGMVASEYQAIEAAFAKLAAERRAVCPVPDEVWTARPSAAADADGGAYIFALSRPAEAAPDTRLTLTCKDKFGRLVVTDRERAHRDTGGAQPVIALDMPSLAGAGDGQPEAMYAELLAPMREWTFAALNAWLEQVAAEVTAEPALRTTAVGLLARLYDRVNLYDTGVKKRSAVRAHLLAGLLRLFKTPAATDDDAAPADPDRRLTWVTLAMHGMPTATRGALYVDATDLPYEGEDRLARVLVRAHRVGWRRFVIFGCKGDRSVGAGLGSDTADVRVDIYGAPGDYLAAGLDGAEVHVHGPAQDQVGHLMTRGRLVIYGDAGQELCCGATGGEVYVLGQVGARAFVGAGEGLRVVVNGVIADTPVPPPRVFTGVDEVDLDALLRQNAALFGLG